MDKRTERVVATLLLCVMLTVEIGYVGMVLRPDRSGAVGGAAWESYKALKPDSLDVVFLGSSHAFCGFDPAEIWRERGIPSFVNAGPAQMLEVSEYYLRESLRTQHPKVVVLEMAPASYSKRTFSPAFHATNVALMPWSANKLGASWNATPVDMRLNILLDAWSFHGRWDGLTARDFDLAAKRKQATYLKGFNPNFRATEVTSTTFVRPESDYALAKAGFDYNIRTLHRIAKLCEERDIQLLCVLAPTGPPEGYTYFLDRAREELGGSKNVRFLDLSRVGAVEGLSYKTDFLDGGHVNANGAEKTSRTLADYLAETYDLPDRRNQPGFESWDTDAKLTQEYLVKNGAAPLK